MNHKLNKVYVDGLTRFENEEEPRSSLNKQEAKEEAYLINKYSRGDENITKRLY